MVRLNLLTYQISELLGRLGGLQATVEAYRCLDATVSKHPLYCAVVSRMVLQIYRCRSMTKLMNRYPKTDLFLDAVVIRLLNMSLFFG